MSGYDLFLDEEFKDLVINLVRNDTSPTGFPAYIEVHLKRAPKDKSQTVLDLGNYIYRRLGLKYQHTPEYRGKGKSTTVRWFMSWDDVQPIKANILRALNKPEDLLKHREYLPVEFSSLIIQDTSRGVRPGYREHQ